MFVYKSNEKFANTSVLVSGFVLSRAAFGF